MPRLLGFLVCTFALCFISACGITIRSAGVRTTAALQPSESSETTNDSISYIDEFDALTMKSWWMRFADTGSYWPNGGDTASTITQDGSVLSIGETASNNVGFGYETVTSFDFTGASTWVALTTPPSPVGAQYREAGLWIMNPAGDGWEIFTSESGGLTAGTWLNTNSGNQSSYGIDVNANPYIRIRHETAGDTIEFESSADGSTWASVRSMARGGIPITDMRLILYGYQAKGATPNDGSPVAEFDHFGTDATPLP
jgi:hypothetical protein